MNISKNNIRIYTYIYIFALPENLVNPRISYLNGSGLMFFIATVCGSADNQIDKNGRYVHSLYIYIYIYMYMHICVYIYIYRS